MSEPRIHLQAVGPHGAGRHLIGMQAASFNGALWPMGLAKRAIYLPLVIPQEASLRFMTITNAGNSTGTFDMAIYDYATGTRLHASTGGSIARSSSTNQHLAIPGSPLVLARGWYYVGAVASEITTGTYFCTAAPGPTSIPIVRSCGALQEDLAATTMPATMTPATITACTTIPLLGVCTSASF